jgi:N-acetylmuramate 1-kinase
MGKLSWARETRLAGDASYRSYARVVASSGIAVIRVTYPPDRTDALARDDDVLAWLSGRGFRVPRRLQLVGEPRQLYLEDLGEEDAEQTLRRCDTGQRAELIGRLATPLATLAAIPLDQLPAWNPPLGSERLREELAGFEMWFLGRVTGIAASSDTAHWLDDLAASIGRHPRRVCHRDYHLNNLFFLQSGEIGVIDVQDILIGPDTYDAVSLVGERAFPELIEEQAIREWLAHWAEVTAAESGWKQRMLETRTQRALKVLGTFACLNLAGRRGYSRWMRPLAWRAMPALRDLAAPPELVNTLLEWLEGGSHVR